MSLLPADHAERMRRARLALEGLSVGDAFGGRFFLPDDGSRVVPAAPWAYSDDTEMALAIVSALDRHGRIEHDGLARDFARRFRADPDRGYGQSVRRVLDAIADGLHWREAAAQVFDGQGSMGNGGAMRAAPIGAYFSDDLDAVIEHARASAATTHAHPEGQAGAIAVALAAAWAAGRKDRSATGHQLMEAVWGRTPEGATRSGIGLALSLAPSLPVAAAVEVLGNGQRITAPDTVPFALWCAARHLDSYADALWAVASAGGDNDTNGAIVGGIVALSCCPSSIPEGWLLARERLGE